MDPVVEVYQTPEALRAVIKRYKEKQFRQDTCTLKRISGWPRGRWYHRERDDDLLYVIITNDPLLNYLDFGNYALFHEELDFFTDNFKVQDRAERHPMTLDSTMSCARQNSHVTTWQHCAMARHYLEEEHKLRVLMNLLREWNPERYWRLLTHRLDGFVSDFMHANGFKFLIETMRLRCEDSYFIIHVFRQICERVHEDNNSQFLTLLSNTQMQFFMRHLMRVDYSTEVHRAWLVTEDLLRNGFLQLDNQIVRDALEVGGPSCLLPSGIPLEYDAVNLASYWPREKDGIKRRSFYSCEYYVMFTDALVYTILDMRSDKGLVECFKLLWRAVPTPYLPIGDMRACMHRFRASFARTGPPQWERAIGDMWNLVEHQFFAPGDLPTVYGPRRLKHLCRVCIRQWCRSPERILRLLSHRTLSGGLQKPDSLVDYMNLEF